MPKDLDWLLQSKETHRRFADATWIPLRKSVKTQTGDVCDPHYCEEFFGLGSMAFFERFKPYAEEHFDWSDIGLHQGFYPYSDQESYVTVHDFYDREGKEIIGVRLVYEYAEPVSKKCRYLINNDLIMALRLVKDGNVWRRPEEDYVDVIRETFDKDGNSVSVEIKREFLLDYLAARDLVLRLSYYRQRVFNVEDLEGTPYETLSPTNGSEPRDGGEFELHISSLTQLYGSSWHVFNVWRTDVDAELDAPRIPPNDWGHTDSKSYETPEQPIPGFALSGEFWRNEWIEHTGLSTRVRHDDDPHLPTFVTGTAGERQTSTELNTDNGGCWLFFKTDIISEVLRHKGFSFHWATAYTGVIHSPSGYRIHFGINAHDLITVFAHDIAQLPTWEQHLWAGFNIVPDGKLCEELYLSQVAVQPADTEAIEITFFKLMYVFDRLFIKHTGHSIYIREVSDEDYERINRFHCRDRASLLCLAKDLVRVFLERLDLSLLRELTHIPKPEKLGSIKLLERLLTQCTSEENARYRCSIFVGVYELRIGDAHPAESKIEDALRLARIDTSLSYLKQGTQLLVNFANALRTVGLILQTSWKTTPPSTDEAVHPSAPTNH